MYRFNRTAQFFFFFLIPARAADGATVCKVNCYSNEFSLRMAFNSRNVSFFWQLQFLKGRLLKIILKETLMVSFKTKQNKIVKITRKICFR